MRKTTAKKLRRMARMLSIASGKSVDNTHKQLKGKWKATPHNEKPKL